MAEPSLRAPVALPVRGDSATADFVREAQHSLFDFQGVSAKSAGNVRLKASVNKATLHQYTQRQAVMPGLPDPDGLRTLAGNIKQHAIENLDYYLEQLKANVEKNGGHVHFAATADDARRIIMGIVERTKSTRVVKSKSMASEEIELAHLMEEKGLDVVETDLGEFIVQIGKDKPSHIVAPIIHLDTAQIADLMCAHFGVEHCVEPKKLAEYARVHLRDKFRRADLGMTGGELPGGGDGARLRGGERGERTAERDDASGDDQPGGDREGGAAAGGSGRHAQVAGA